MPDWKARFGEYWRYTRFPFQNILIVLPVIFAYELGIFFFNRSDMHGLRNGADVLLRYFLGLAGVYGFYAFAVSLMLIVLVVLWLEYQREGRLELRPAYFGGMLLESLLYGLVLFVLLSRFTAVDLQVIDPVGISTTQRIVLAFGAGVYEEFVFRVLIISGIALLLRNGAGWKPWSAAVIGILFSAVIFSMFHYVGEYGEVFQARTFIIRSFAGVMLSVLYVLRGFGITVYSHIIYDLIIILSLPSTGGG